MEENAPRQGFFEHTEYLAIREHLIPDYQDILDFAYYSGWRKKEITRLTWPEVVLPSSTPLREVFARRLMARRLDTQKVFHKNGKPIGDWRKRWNRACELAGLLGKHLHDCRRTTARNLVRAGVPEAVAMKLIGHKTRSMFDRYNIVSEADLKQATTRLADYVTAHPTSPVVVPLPKVAEGRGR